MNYGDFKQRVIDFAGKKHLEDKVPDFISIAKLSLQRQFDFSFTRKSEVVGYPGTTNTGVVLPPDFKNFYGDLAVSVTVNGLTVPIELTTEQRERRRLFQTTLTTYTQAGIITSMAEFTSNNTTPIRAYVVKGPNIVTLFTVPEQLNQSLTVVYYSWLPDYDEDSDEDWLLIYGHDALLWETMKVINQFLFEEDRVAINEVTRQAAFEALIEFDGNLQRSNSPIDMD